MYGDENIVLSPVALSGDNLEDRNHFVSNVRNFISQEKIKTKSNIKVFVVSIHDNRALA